MKIKIVGSILTAILLIGCGSSSKGTPNRGSNANTGNSNSVNGNINNSNANAGNSNGVNGNSNNSNVNNNSNAPADNNQSDCNKSVDVNSYPKSNLSQELKDGISYMGNEERLAYDVYHNLYNYHLAESGVAINQLKNISERSEIKHVGIVQDMVRKYELTPEDVTNVIDPVASRDVKFEDMPSGRYDIPAIQGLYDALYAKGVGSTKDALEVGCMVEVTDVNDLDKYIVMAEKSNAPDITEAFNFLRDGSYNHYWGFDTGLKNLGITDGCCSLGTVDGVNYCHNEYPNTEANQTTSGNNQGGQGNGQGRGQGRGNGQGRR
jgi:hypothetical protein